MERGLDRITHSVFRGYIYVALSVSRYVSAMFNNPNSIKVAANAGMI